MFAKFPLTLGIVFVASVAVTISGGRPLLGSNVQQSENSGFRPVIVELFTSEGCSSCPPADAFLKKLDDAGRIENADIIAMEEHVDYWDRQGWTDPFSSHDWTERQQLYSRAFRHDGIYTPQLIVNGSNELVGVSNREALQRIVEAAKNPGAQLQLSLISLAPKSVQFSILTQSTPPGARTSDLWLAVTERGLTSNVLHGENEGRNLSHAAVLRSLTRISWSAKNSLAAEATAKIPLDPTWQRENLRFVVFLQDRKSLHILGAAATTATGGR
jgi:hypothetical protein